MIRIGRQTILAIVLACLTQGPAYGKRGDGIPATSQIIEVMGFSPSGREVLLKVQDDNQGTVFQVRDAKKNRVLSHHPARDDADRVWRRLKDKHQVDEEHKLSSKNPRKPWSLMTEADDGQVIIYVRIGDKLTEYERLKTLRPRKGPPAEAFVKQIVWGPKGKHVALVYHQKFRDLLEWEGDFVHAFKLRSYRLEAASP